MTIDEASSRLIAGIYAGAHDANRWNSAITQIVERTQSRFAFVATFDTEDFAFPSTATYGCDEGRFLDGIAEYAAVQYRDDPITSHVGRHPAGRMVRSIDLYTAAAYLEDPYVRWSRETLGSAFWQVYYSPPEPGLLSGLTPGMALHRSADKAPFTASESRFAALMFDHMANAVRLAAQPMPLEGHSGATLLLDAGGRVREASDAARLLLAQGDGLHVAEGRLRTSYGTEQARLDLLIASALDLACARSGGALSIARPSARRALILRASPYVDPPAPFSRFRPAALVRIIVPDANPSADAARHWATLFGLTPAEARLVGALLTSETSLRETAERLGIGYATARTQLGAIFSKTDTRSQAQLARLATQLEL